MKTIFPHPDNQVSPLEFARLVEKTIDDITAVVKSVTPSKTLLHEHCKKNGMNPKHICRIAGWNPNFVK